MNYFQLYSSDKRKETSSKSSFPVDILSHQEALNKSINNAYYDL